MDVDKIMMFLIMFDMCNDADGKEKTEEASNTHVKKKQIRTNKHQSNTVQRHDSKAPKMKAFKRRL
jgi:hypothetical protein